jgi:hypothetical protein
MAQGPFVVELGVGAGVKVGAALPGVGIDIIAEEPLQVGGMLPGEVVLQTSPGQHDCVKQTAP